MRNASQGCLARYVTPEPVAEVEFTEFTVDSIVRHRVFKKPRRDKPANDVVLERA